MISKVMQGAQRLVRSTTLLRYAALVVAPTLVVAAYLALFASEGYISRAQVMVEQDMQFSAPSIALGILSLGSPPSKLDALVVQTFMHSRTMLEYLDEQLDLFGHFSSSEVDWLSRLSANASAEEFLEYYRSRLSTTVSQDSFIIEVDFVAYDPEFARAVTDRLVQRSEEFVNEVSHHLAREQLEFVTRETERAHQKLKAASREMIELQRQYEVFNPQTETEAASKIIAGLQQELTEQRTELKALSGYLNPSTPEVAVAKRRITALEQQISQERGKLVGSGKGGLNDVMLAYQDAQVNLTLASEVYRTALATLEATRLEAARKVKYLVSVSRPSLPDSSELPRAGHRALTTFVFLNLAYFVLGLIIATIQDHRE